ncbi:Pex12 amino terminal region-domain-containing protein [Podospora aff. communis PSN243]|uniref:Peroxisome assembly protein 12 n=1 Tax=Podospora aff. communis PSN243 TaxID=3040156 RepID=A0AAV9GQU0_9PEZI|nr:Pex12 amino terminal region-domain-containing protein [Podospora aff. communis PSN243]
MEFMTALRGTFDDGKPSLFELLSEQQLAALLPPTLRYLLTVATHRYPRHLLRALNSFDELYALAALLVEHHYLRTRAGTFTENFYGLKREKALVAEVPRAARAAPSALNDALRLTTPDIYRNLAVTVLLPYLKRKLDEAHEVDAPRALLGAAYNQPPARGAPFRERILYYYRWFLRNVYPSVNAAYYFSFLAFQLAYLFDRSKYHDPFLWMIGTRVRRMNSADYHAIEAALEKAAAKGAGGRPGSALTPRAIGARLMGGLSLVLPTSIFALKFLEWWYASDFAKQLSRKAGESLDLPPPVLGTGVVPPVAKGKGVKKAKGDEGEDEGDREKPVEDAPIAASSLLPIYTVLAPTDSSLCPICEGEITTATACQTGVVYCYTCIHKWMEGTHPRQEKFMTDKEGKWEIGEGRCAVTGRKVLGGTGGLRRIMV